MLHHFNVHHLCDFMIVKLQFYRYFFKQKNEISALQKTPCIIKHSCASFIKIFHLSQICMAFYIFCLMRCRRLFGMLKRESIYTAGAGPLTGLTCNMELQVQFVFLVHKTSVQWSPSFDSLKYFIRWQQCFMTGSRKTWHIYCRKWQRY